MTANHPLVDSAEASAIGSSGGSRRTHHHHPNSRNNKRRRRLDPSSATVVVVGAGLAGLSVAVSLYQKAGFRKVHVYERDPSLDHQKEGYGLTLTYNPKGPLQDLGVLETLASRDCPSRSHYLFYQQPQRPKQQHQQHQQQQDDNDDDVSNENVDGNGIEPKEDSSSAAASQCATATATASAIPMGYFGNAFHHHQRSRGYGQRGNLRVPRKVLRKILHDAFVRGGTPLPSARGASWANGEASQPHETSDNQHHHQDPNSIGSSSSSSSTSSSSLSPERVVHWNRTLVEFHWVESKRQYRLVFSGTSTAAQNQSTPASQCTEVVWADLLVAADGIRSAVLQQLYDQERARQLAKAPETLKGALLSAVARPNDGAFEPKATPHNFIPVHGSNRYNNNNNNNIRAFPERYGLRPMGIRMILGIADGIDHPLLRERGFYTVDDHGHRLFTMPYRSNRFDIHDEVDDKINSEDVGTHKNANTNTNLSQTRKNYRSQNRIMWQLSFPAPNNPDTLDSDSLRNYVLDACGHWHPPVLDLVHATPPSGIWGTDLMDREPRRVYQELVVGGNNSSKQPRQPRLVVCGDALHSMSPFKGQGANQALADGPLLAKWLTKSSVDAALTNWWRETLQRTVPVVEASRKAARDWHDPSKILQTGSENGTDQGRRDYHGFAGVKPSARASLIQVLKERDIGPHLGGSLDERIREVISEHGWFDDGDDDNGKRRGTKQKEKQQSSGSPPLSAEDLCQIVLQLAVDGDTAGFRSMSLPSSGDHQRSCRAMVEARDARGRSCLHLAALGNHYSACQWLLTELRILEQWKQQHNSVTVGNIDGEASIPSDNSGKTALNCALESGNKKLIHLFRVVLAENSIPSN